MPFTFSVITVTKDNLSGLQKTCASMQEQHYKNYEWIVIDGASKDGTVAWLGSLRIPNARAVTESDRGIYDAMNKGIKRATGDYIVFMNAGDLFAGPETLALVENTLHKTVKSPAVVYGDALEERPRRKGPAYKKAHSHKGIAKGLFTHHQAIFYHRKTLCTLRYDTDYKIAADYKFTAQVLQQAAEQNQDALYIPHALCLFEAGGISQRRVRKARKEQAAIRTELGLVSETENKAITTRQAAASALKRFCPPLFWFLRARR